MTAPIPLPEQGIPSAPRPTSPEEKDIKHASVSMQLLCCQCLLHVELRLQPGERVMRLIESAPSQRRVVRIECCNASFIEALPLKGYAVQ